MRKIFSKITDTHLLFLGFFIILAAQIPTLLLGTDSVVPYHDQLDGEMIAYIYQAKYLFSGENIIPEFLSGAPKSALTPPAPLAVILFKIFEPFTAYSVLTVLVQSTAYAGMFLLINRICKNKYIAFLTGVLYAFLPFLPVYGLAQYGAPLLVLSFLNLYNKKHLLWSYLYVALYAAMSSLVLVGFAWLTVGVLLFLYAAFTAKIKEQKHLLLSFLPMLGVYLAENASLIMQVLGINDGFTSHKADYILAGADFFTQFWGYWSADTLHTPDHHFALIPILIGTFIFVLITWKHQTADSKKSLKIIGICMSVILVSYFIAAIWDTALFIPLRNRFGALGTLQLSRFTWIAPVFWYISLALCIQILCSSKTFIRWLQYTFCILCLALISFQCLKTAFVKSCVQELLLPDYEFISWNDYYAPDIMSQIEEYIRETDGLSKDEYKVASLGIDPAAALYNGYYTIDGYSNNYPLEYKVAFREIIADEIAASEWLQFYYDDWGNRCYLFSAEYPGYYTIAKKSFAYTNSMLNTDALKKLGCDYIFAAAPIENASEIHLTPMRKESFETADSYYEIFLYKISD